MHITLTQDEISVAVANYMQTNFQTLDVSSADISINENGEAEIAIVSKAEPKPTGAKRTTRKKVQPKKAAEKVEKPVENVVQMKDEVAEDEPPFDVDPVEETKDEVAKEEAPVTNSKSLFA